MFVIVRFKTIRKDTQNTNDRDIESDRIMIMSFVTGYKEYFNLSKRHLGITLLSFWTIKEKSQESPMIVIKTFKADFKKECTNLELESWPRGGHGDGGFAVGTFGNSLSVLYSVPICSVIYTRPFLVIFYYQHKEQLQSNPINWKKSMIYLFPTENDTVTDVVRIAIKFYLRIN